MQPTIPNEFDEVIDRRSSNSMKWEVSSKFLTHAQRAVDPLPMWVADMDFRAPQAVIDALHEAVSFGVFGYPAGPSKGYLEAISEWQQRRFGWEIESEWIVPISGVIAGLKTAIQAFSSAGDSILIQPPVYSHFHSDVIINGRHITAAPLTLDNNRYQFDPVIFEKAIRDDTKIFILSNPHNPTGNVWSEEELRTMGEICLRHDVLVVADEIHQDFVLSPSRHHIPFASIDPRFSENSITCTSASKTFNLAGLQCANLIIPNSRLRWQFNRRLDKNQFTLVNLMGMVATEAAYRHGEDWLERLLKYIHGNHMHFATAINGAGLGIKVHEMDSLYLAWMDCRALDMPAADLEDFIITRGRIWFDKGQKFGVDGHGFLRANLACPRSVVDEAISRLGKILSNI
ncbi:MalY/PatB family protein [Vogesella indigofera]|uniref:MalY/PatB family protein n=1 Tax=Vogesella indigofera TaxID=45465 RepID=UPI00234E8C74|nr:MalY/PatB family protein [Vogesella indigofera]MDC7710833.1 pyridoxal phosphate-dependent aminotransferase [Vogesella indigofera]